MTKLFNLGLHVSALVATPALADPPSPGHNRSIVRTADLDLGSADGQRRLDRRLVEAVNQACGMASDADLAGSNAVRRCRETAHAAIAGERNRLVKLASRGAVVAVTASR